MEEAERQLRIVLLCAAPLTGALIASYLRHQFRGAAIEECTTADICGSQGEPDAFVLVEPSAPAGVHSIARAIGYVRALGAQAPILVAAASPNPAGAAEALRCGAQGFVADIVPISGVAEALRVVLAGQPCFQQRMRLVNESDVRQPPPALLGNIACGRGDPLKEPASGGAVSRAGPPGSQPSVELLLILGHKSG